MKINKILAAGAAATIAVTSLSAVVGAEVQSKTFDVYQTFANDNITLKINADVNRDIADNLVQDDVQKLVFEDLVTTLLKSYDGNAAVTKAYAGREVDYDLTQRKGIRITATGYQEANSSASVTKTFLLKNTQEDGKGDWYIVVLDKKTPVYHDGEFASFFFHRITNLTFEIDLKANTSNETLYKEWSDGNNVYDFEIGDIAIQTRLAADGTKWSNDGTNAPAAHDYIYGLYSDTSNTVDKAKVLSEAASMENTPLVIANTYLRGADVEKGKAFTPATTIYQKLSATGTTTKALATNPTAAMTFKAVTPTNATPIVIGSEIFGGEYNKDSDGYIYVTGTGAAKDYVIWSPVPISDTDLAKVVTGTTDSIEKVAANFATISTTGKIVEIAAANVLVAQEFTDYVVANNGIGENQTAGTPTVKALVLGANGKWIDGSGAEYLAAAAGSISVSQIGAGDSTAHLLAYAFANGGWYESESAYGDVKGTYRTDGKVLYENQYKPSAGVSTYKWNGWLPKTTLNSTSTKQNKIERRDVWLLSSTNDNNSTGRAYNPWAGTDQDTNQSYEATFWDGTAPMGFAGLASQVADFFNKQDNGKITFTFAAAAGNTSGKWSDGVPSTEVGLKGYTSEYLHDFALFFNYLNTTGTMISAEKLDVTAGTITFDIADYLKDCGGLTKATLENIYYGLDNGIEDLTAWSRKYGLWVSKVELSYDDAGAAAVDATTDDDTAEDNAAVVVADDDDDDAKVEDDDIFEDDDVIEDDDDDDDDVDADVIEDDDDDDTDVNNDVDYVDAGADDDANPGTGVGLAVIPAIVAAAAVVVSKKRK